MKINPKTGLTSTETCEAMNQVYDDLRKLTDLQLDVLESRLELKAGTWAGYPVLKHQINVVRERRARGEWLPPNCN